MPLNDIKNQTKSLLYKHYNIRSDVLPEPRPKAKWTNDNKYGFLMGILEYGEQVHIHQMHQLLSSKDAEKEQESSLSQASIDENIQSFISKMVDYYILPFYQPYNSNTHLPPVSVDSSTESSSVESTKDVNAHLHDDVGHVQLNDGPLPSSSSTPPRPSSSSNSSHRRLTQNSLKKALIKRDGVCLFCWASADCVLDAAHIIAPFVSIDNSSQLQNAGLIHEHQVQNGLLLCVRCHRFFDNLKYYVDIVDNQLVVKIVNESNDPRDKNLAKQYAIIHLIRCNEHRRWITRDDRQPMERNGEMALYFLSNNSEELPNRTALQFHKTACLIWRMAGGAVDDDESSDEDNDDDRRVVPITYNRKNVQQWINSNATLIADIHK